MAVKLRWEGQMQGPAADPDELVYAEFSNLSPDEEIDAWGMARATGVEPLTAENILNQLVQEGLAVKEGNWYSMNLGSAD